MSKKILIATGGTGGHVFPAYSLSKYFLKKKYNIELISDRRGMRYLKNYSDLKINLIDTITIFQRNPLQIIKASIILILALIKSFFFIIKKKPDIILGMGGYSSFPICIVGKLFKIKVILYENNLIIGKTNKFLLPFIDQIFVSYDKILNINEKYKKKFLITGNILREEITNFKTKNIIKKDKNLTLLILGGSQAAQVFGEKLPKIFSECKKNNMDLKIIQQCTSDQIDILKEFYKNNKFNYEIFTFTKNIIKYFDQVDLAISRSGSSMSAELINCRIPFISIPLPSSAENHQLFNAKYFESQGFSFLVEERNIEKDLFTLIKSIHEDKSLLNQMREKQKKQSDKKVFELIDKEITKSLNEKN